MVDTAPNFILFRVGKEVLAGDFDRTTRFWRNFAVADRNAFQKGDKVGVRIKTTPSPSILREIADAATWKWLQKVRSETLPATLVRIEPEAMTVRFEDATTFTYRTTAKTGCTIKGLPTSLIELEEGQRLYVRGRLASNLDTTLIAVSDTAEGTRKPSAKLKPLDLPNSGRVQGNLERHLPALRMFDITHEGHVLHITYRAGTVFLQEGKKALPANLNKGQRVQVAYKRDGFGRLIATKVELFQAG